MRLLSISTAALFGTSWALDCESVGLNWLNSEFLLNNLTETPPSWTNQQLYFNPCEAVTESRCWTDDHLCMVEEILNQDTGKKLLSAVKPFGDPSHGALEQYSISNDRIDIKYENALWGTQSLLAYVGVECGNKRDSTFYIDGSTLNVQMKHPQVCSMGDPNNPGKPGDGGNNNDDDNEEKKKGGWGFFTWLFVLLLLAAIGYAALTVYINFAQSRGNLPLAADVGDVLRDLPYLLRDIFQKLNFFSRRSSSSGYSAI